MNKLLKYILIVNLVFIILGSLVIFLNKLTSSLTILTPLSYLLLYLIPLVIIVMSGMYQFKNLNFKGFLKSLLIPISYFIVVFIIIIILGSYFFEGGEESFLAIVVFWTQIVITFVAVFVINLIVFFVGRVILKKKEKSTKK